MTLFLGCRGRQIDAWASRKQFLRWFEGLDDISTGILWLFPNIPRVYLFNPITSRTISSLALGYVDIPHYSISCCFFALTTSSVVRFHGMGVNTPRGQQDGGGGHVEWEGVSETRHDQDISKKGGSNYKAEPCGYLKEDSPKHGYMDFDLWCHYCPALHFSSYQVQYNMCLSLCYQL